MERYNGPGALAGAAEAGVGYAEERRPDTTLIDLRLATTRRLRRQRHVDGICRIGPRVVFELIDELDRHYGLGDDLDRRLARYAAIEPGVLRAIGGDRFPPRPLREVR